ncbi:MAG: Rrf2 family transcriptional regulator [Candidatus Margulisbacteria bacterium]|nr:Rrf2 family transcriptional regulator [Candidatus Margulisiibacteriota bacterium]MBU1022380.1 Rrf2 family transcriptional regulator [Candidatus Margulisiibacteriota bacterium]MBU1729068.1 Rrf2 family transcriptional regulator [Candidatus Margulisiibacteriota bacterium]MBU1954511.1 Rrf2 family transcriptional regulator [Candidatus Margulisiibacteriota bacterium]
MKITRASDYTIRLLIHLASQGGVGTSEALAKELDIPFNHLAKLVQTLSRRGYLITRKGKGGGLRLALDPRKINLASIIEMMDGPMILNECILHRENCRFSGKCKFRRYLSQVRNQMLTMFENKSIYDLVPAK